MPGEQVYTTNEGPVVITTRGKYVFVSESFDLDLARKLTALVLDAQGTGELKRAGTAGSELVGRDSANKPSAPSLRLFSGARVGYQESDSSFATDRESETFEPLTANLVRFISNCGVMKAAVTAAVQAAK